MIFKKKEKNPKQPKEKKLRVYKANTHKKTVIVLWVLLAVSLCFAVYKNFTAIDIHTIHETTVIEKEIVDTHKVENFVENFAKVYYSWEQTAASIDGRNNAINNYLTAELQALNTDTIRKDIPVSSSVSGVQIWSVTQDGENQFSITFTVLSQREKAKRRCVPPMKWQSMWMALETWLSRRIRPLPAYP